MAKPGKKYLKARDLRTKPEFSIDEAVKLLKQGAFAKFDESVDVAMFGRMQASSTDFQIYAARQMSHAFGVNVLPDEIDYFTAVDDVKEAGHIAGAGHINTLSCN